MRITLLGTGTPSPSLKRMCSSYVVEAGDDVLVFDHGAGSHHRLLEAGYTATDVTHFVCSHLHYDHCMDYPRLLITRWDQGGGKIPELQVLGPPGIERMTHLLIDDDGVFGPDLIARTNHPLSMDVYRNRGGQGERARPAPEIRELRSGDVVERKDWTLTVASVPHVQPYLVCYGFRLDTPEGSFVYSGDSGPSTAMEKLAAGADVLVHMCQHITGTEPSEAYAKGCMGHLELARLGAKSGVRTLVMSHMLLQLDVPGVRERLIAEMKAIYDGNLIWGEDLMEIPIGDPAPARMD
jgi:ribonuclease BN (tRNA processing enzyme)